ncbi:hypothetical protein YC2023_109537 [Brassica napus]
MEDSHSPEEQTKGALSPEEQTEGASSSEEQFGGTFSPVLFQNDDHDTRSGDEETSEAPRKFKSMVDIMERAPRVELDEAAQAIEASALDGVDLMEEEYQVLNRYGSGHRRNDGFYIGKTSEKLHPIENPEDIIVQSAGLMMHTLFSEPMLLILTDPRTDHPGNSIFELMSFFPYTTDSFVLTWILCVPVCCRPLRKVDTFLFLNILNQLTKVVQLVKLEKDPCAAFCFDHRSQITLDDANDVGMIQEADTAVCISGFQIMQFMTAQFRFLERLLMFMETEAINE